MKYPNPKFTGMSIVTNQAIDSAILDYYPNKSQKGGSQRLDLLKKATDLDTLIDFCIDGYRAWGDAVLMGAGAYLKIGNFPSEIDAAKKYVKQEVLQYFHGTAFASQNEYDAWHKEVCENLSNCKQYFVKYSKRRKASNDKFKNKSGFTIGNAQKFLNMLMKDMYTCLYNDSTFLPNYEDYFKFCHMPLDSYILRFVDDIRYRENIKNVARTYTWSNVVSYNSYMEEQTVIRNYIAKHNSTVTVLQTEFVVWPLYK